MSLRFRDLGLRPIVGVLLILLCFVAAWIAVSAVASPSTATVPSTATAPADGLAVPGVLRIAADPNDLPFSNDKLEGFENKIAAMIAQDLGVRVEYLWRAQRRGFVRETIKAGDADLMLGVPTELEMTLPTAPYYRSTYALVSRASDDPVRSLDDARLKTLHVGIPLTGDASPPALALARRRIVENVAGFSVFDDYAKPNPTARIIDAVREGQIDVAIAWGPLASYFAAQASPPLHVALLPDSADNGVTFAFSVSMGVKRGNKALKARVDAVLKQRQSEIEKILDSYHVPRLPIPAAPAAAIPKISAGGGPCQCD